MKSGERSKGAIALARLGKTQAEVAVRLGVSTGIVAMWLSGQRTPGLPNRKTIQERFGIAIESWDQAPERVVAASSSRESDVPPWGDNAALSRVERLQRIVDTALDDLEGGGGDEEDMTPLERAKVMADLARTLGAIRRLKGEEVSEVKVLKHPKWQAIRDAVLDELQDHPDLLERIVVRLEEDERKSA